MGPTSVEIYMEQIGRALSDPVGLMAALALLGLCVVVILSKSARWLALALALYVITISDPSTEARIGATFIRPLEFLRSWSRPVTFGLLLVTATAAFRFDKGSRQRLLPISFWVFIAYQVLTCLWLLPTALANRGLVGLGMVMLLVIIFGLALAPSLQSLRDATWALWAVAALGLCFIGATMLQYLVNPYSVAFGKRLFGTASNPQLAGLILSFTLPTMCYLLVRRKQGLWVTLNLVVFSTAIPLGVLLLIWTGSRTGMLVAITGLTVFFHRRLGRFTLAAAVCLGVGLLLAPYMGAVFEIADRLIWTENTRAAAWARMWYAIQQNPWFGTMPEESSIYTGNTVGEGAFLMSMSIYGIVGTIPLLLAFLMIFVELLRLYRHRKAVPELADMIDLLGSFWASFMVANVFESLSLAYFTISILLMYTFYVIQGFALDCYQQAVDAPQREFPGEYESLPLQGGFAA
jgi:hypothetical protein